MEMSKAEVKVLAQAEKQGSEAVMAELAELELALCAGGVGEVVLA